MSVDSSGISSNCQDSAGSGKKIDLNFILNMREFQKGFVTFIYPYISIDLFSTQPVKEILTLRIIIYYIVEVQRVNS
jgi:hypothetical protein